MRRYRLFRLSRPALVLAALSMFQAAALRAQPSDSNAAGAEYRKAYAAIAKEDWAKAREILLGLWTVNRTYDVASSLGQVEFKLRHYGSAARFMAFALANVAPSEKPEFVQRLRNGLRELRLKVGTLRVVVNEPGAELIFGDEVLGTSPLEQEVFLDAGSHVLTARKNGRTARADVSLKAGEGLDVTLTLPPEGPPAPPVSGLGVETSPAVPRNSTTAPPTADRAHSPSLVPVVVGGAVVAASLATGVGLRISANGSYNDADDLRRKNGAEGCMSGAAPQADCDAQTEANRSGDSKANFSTVAFGVAGGALLATAAYWFWPRESSTLTSRPNARFHSSVSNSGGFIGVSCDF